ncbi:hypothetical protein D3C80_435370 [compost metagenome]
MINQCDGCQAGIPKINGVHRMGREGGYPDFLGCTAKLYEEVNDAKLHPERELDSSQVGKEGTGPGLQGG